VRKKLCGVETRVDGGEQEPRTFLKVAKRRAAPAALIHNVTWQINLWACGKEGIANLLRNIESMTF
jgi:hypothetical protein